MGLLADAGLLAAKTLAAQVGPEAALRTILELVPRTSPSQVRAAAIVEGLELALRARQAEAVERLAFHWCAESTAFPAPQIPRLIARLVEAGLAPAALSLAEAEHDRSGSASALWLRAVAREHAGTSPTRSAQDYAEVAHAARAQGALALCARAERERCRVLLECEGRAHDALTLHRSLQAPAAPSGRDLWVAARAGLSASGRYERVAALDSLLSWIDPDTHPSPAHTRAALRVVAAHVERMGARLTRAEAERVSALAALAPALPEGDELAARLRAAVRIAEASPQEASRARTEELLRSDEGALRHARMRAALGGHALGPEPSTHAREWRALRVLAALEAGEAARARPLLLALTGEATDAPPSLASVLYTVAWRGLAHAESRAAALTLAEVLTRRGRSYPPPPRGFLHLAAKLEQAGARPLALRALELASDVLEPGAAAALAEAWVREGFAAHAQGRRADAIAALERARALAQSGG